MVEGGEESDLFKSISNFGECLAVTEPAWKFGDLGGEREDLVTSTLGDAVLLFWRTGTFVWIGILSTAILIVFTGINSNALLLSDELTGDLLPQNCGKSGQDLCCMFFVVPRNG